MGAHPFRAGYSDVGVVETNAVRGVRRTKKLDLFESQHLFHWIDEKAQIGG
jgi:hypothetical protein